MHTRLHTVLLVVACVLAACSDSDSDGGTVSPSSTTTVVSGSAATVSSGQSAPSTNPHRSSYNTTPLRSDGQRVTFRLTTTDGVTGEVSLAPLDTTIDRIQSSVSLIRPDGQTAGGRDVFSSRADDEMFAGYCASVLGGNCTPRSTEALAEGNRVETYGRADGGISTRVVFGPWAILVQGRDVADSFSFRNGPDGFPLITARGGGWSTSSTELNISTVTGRYVMRSDPSGTCGVPAARVTCDRGLSIQSFGPDPDATLHRMN